MWVGVVMQFVRLAGVLTVAYPMGVGVVRAVCEVSLSFDSS